jgi:hypothetical protein
MIYGILFIIWTLLLLSALDLISFKRLSIFNTPFYKRTIGVISIIASIVLAFGSVRVLPPFMKIVVIGLIFTFIYFIIQTLFKNKNQ